MQTVKVSSQAKINLFLAITGKRSDGFHSLVSVVSQTGLKDELAVSLAVTGFTLTCTHPLVPTDQRNLIIKAAHLFAEITGYKGGAHFTLNKVIPMGAGLGGGSSNAVACLKALSELTGLKIEASLLKRRSAELGSDCPLFLSPSPCVIRGRGETVDALPSLVLPRMTAREAIVFKPDFGISTAWAYARMAELKTAYISESEAERKLNAWVNNPDAPLEDLLFNAMQQVAFDKYPCLPIMANRLQTLFGLTVLMSGSGSACFALLPLKNRPNVASIIQEIRYTLGQSTFVTLTSLESI